MPSVVSAKTATARTADEVRDLREQAARSGTVCADCFQPLAPDALVTMQPARCYELGNQMVATRADLSALLACEHDAIPAQELDRRLDVVRQIRQTLPLRGMWTPAAGLRHPVSYPARMLRRLPPQHAQRPCPRGRRVRHEQIDCAVCGELFTPKRKDAVTCSNRCRQKLHRQRAR